MVDLWLVANGLASFSFSFFGGVMAFTYIGSFLSAVREVATGSSDSMRGGPASSTPPQPVPDTGLFTVAGLTVRYAPLGMVVVPVLVTLMFWGLEQCRHRVWLRNAVEAVLSFIEGIPAAVIPAWVLRLHDWGQTQLGVEGTGRTMTKAKAKGI